MYVCVYIYIFLMMNPASYLSTFLNAPSFGIFLFELLLGNLLEGGKLYHCRILLAWVNIEVKITTESHNGNKCSSCKTNMLLFAFNKAAEEKITLMPMFNATILGTEQNSVSAKSTCTLVVNEDISIESVPEQQDVFRVFKIDICSGEQVGVKTVGTEKEEEVTNIFYERWEYNKRVKLILLLMVIMITFDQRERTQNSQKMGADWAVPRAGLWTGWVEVSGVPPVIAHLYIISIPHCSTDTYVFLTFWYLFIYYCCFQLTNTHIWGLHNSGEK